MSTSKHAFDQVKSILGKLDRAIDATRARRLDPAPAAGAGVGTAPIGSGSPAIPADARREAANQFAEPLATKLDPSQMTARPLRAGEVYGNTTTGLAQPLPRQDFRR